MAIAGDIYSGTVQRTTIAQPIRQEAVIQEEQEESLPSPIKTTVNIPSDAETREYTDEQGNRQKYKPIEVKLDSSGNPIEIKKYALIEVERGKYKTFVEEKTTLDNNLPVEVVRYKAEPIYTAGDKPKYKGDKIVFDVKEKYQDGVLSQKEYATYDKRGNLVRTVTEDAQGASTVKLSQEQREIRAAEYAKALRPQGQIFLTEDAKGIRQVTPKEIQAAASGRVPLYVAPPQPKDEILGTKFSPVALEKLSSTPFGTTEIKEYKRVDDIGFGSVIVPKTATVDIVALRTTPMPSESILGQQFSTKAFEKLKLTPFAGKPISQYKFVASGAETIVPTKAKVDIVALRTLPQSIDQSPKQMLYQEATGKKLGNATAISSVVLKKESLKPLTIATIERVEDLITGRTVTGLGKQYVEESRRLLPFVGNVVKTSIEKAKTNPKEFGGNIVTGAAITAIGFAVPPVGIALGVIGVGTGIIGGAMALQKGELTKFTAEQVPYAIGGGLVGGGRKIPNVVQYFRELPNLTAKEKLVINMEAVPKYQGITKRQQAEFNSLLEQASQLKKGQSIMNIKEVGKRATKEESRVRKTTGAEYDTARLKDEPTLDVRNLLDAETKARIKEIGGAENKEISQIRLKQRKDAPVDINIERGKQEIKGEFVTNRGGQPTAALLEFIKIQKQNKGVIISEDTVIQFRQKPSAGQNIIEQKKQPMEYTFDIFKEGKFVDRVQIKTTRKKLTDVPELFKIAENIQDKTTPSSYIGTGMKVDGKEISVPERVTGVISKQREFIGKSAKGKTTLTTFAKDKSYTVTTGFVSSKTPTIETRVITDIVGEKVISADINAMPTQPILVKTKVKPESSVKIVSKGKVTGMGRVSETYTKDYPLLQTTESTGGEYQIGATELVGFPKKPPTPLKGRSGKPTIKDNSIVKEVGKKARERLEQFAELTQRESEIINMDVVRKKTVGDKTMVAEPKKSRLTDIDRDSFNYPSKGDEIIAMQKKLDPFNIRDELIQQRQPKALSRGEASEKISELLLLGKATSEIIQKQNLPNLSTKSIVIVPTKVQPIETPTTKNVINIKSVTDTSSISELIQDMRTRQEMMRESIIRESIKQPLDTLTPTKIKSEIRSEIQPKIKTDIVAKQIITPKQVIKLEQVIKIPKAPQTPREPQRPRQETKRTLLLTSSQRKKQQVKSRKQGYILLLKRKLTKLGKRQYRSAGFEKASRALTYESAAGLGQLLTSQTARRSYKLQAVEEEGAQVEQYEQAFRQLKSRYQPSRRQGNVMVQQTKFSISSVGEKMEIRKPKGRRNNNAFF